MTSRNQPMESSGSRAFFGPRGLEEEHFCQREQPEGEGALIEGTLRTAQVAGAGKQELSVGYVRCAVSVRHSNLFLLFSTNT